MKTILQGFVQNCKKCIRLYNTPKSCTESNFDISRNPYPGFRQMSKCINVSACTDQIPDTLLVF